MAVERANTIAVLLTILLGQLALTIGEESPFFLVLSVAVCGAWWFNQRVGRDVRLSKGASNLLVLCICAILFLEFLLKTPRSLVVSAAHFVASAQLILLLNGLSVRNSLWICLITLCEFAVSTVRTVEIAYGILLPFLVFAVGITLFINELRMRAGPHGGGLECQVTVAHAAKRLAGLSLVAVAVAVVVFFALPRFQANLFGQNMHVRTQPITGFARRVDLGDIGRIKLSYRKVMDVTLTRNGRKIRGADVPLYWRGVALDKYDGRRWTCTTAPGLVATKYVGVRMRGWRMTNEPGPFAVKQNITLQPINTRTAFVLFPLHQLLIPQRPHVWLDPRSGNLGIFGRLAPAIRYEAISDPVPGVRAQVRAALTATERTRHLQIPDVISRRTRELAGGITSGARLPLEKARGLERFLRNSGNYRYTLDVPHQRGTEPIDSFLFETKTGHCEYYASAMVILLRIVDIPSRMVNGFAGGEWNEFGGFYSVRECHAHSWAEAFLPNMGWTVFDATPDVPSHTGTARWVAGLVTRLFEFIDVKWVNMFIAFSVEDQQEFIARFAPMISRLNLLKAAGRQVFRFFAAVSGLMGDQDVDEEEDSQQESTFLEVISGIGVLVLTLFIAGAIFLVGVKGARILARGKGLDAAGRLYEQFLRQMARRGLKRGESETPLEFARRVVRAGLGETDVVGGVTRAICDLRYGNKDIAPRTMRLLRDKIRRMSKRNP